jgi:oxygen-independent coproporphyrinogen III oxidase
LRRNFQGYTTDDAPVLIGFGTSAIGSLPQGYVQNASSTVEYRSAIVSGRLATGRGIALTDEDRLRRSVIERLMCDLAVDLDVVCREHGVTAGRFAPELKRLETFEADGLARLDGPRITVPGPARGLVRSVCAVFDARLAPGETRHAPSL